MPTTRPIFLFAFANDSGRSLRLFKELHAIRDQLEAVDQELIDLRAVDSARLKDIYNPFNNFHNQISIFHYGGHSDEQTILLEDIPSKGKNLGQVLGLELNLRLVFLNGCSNRGQIQALFDAGVKAVIATSASVEDERAKVFAEAFYQAMARKKTIRESFQTAAAFVQEQYCSLEISFRGFPDIGSEEAEEFPWGLYAMEDADLEWSIDKPFETTTGLLARIRQASRQRYQAFTGPGGRYQYLRIDEALLAGIENTRESKARKLIETRIGEDKTPLEHSLEALWPAECTHTLLVGAGGMGKTVSLIQLWEHYLDTERADWPAPVFIPLNEFNNRPEKGFIRNYIREHHAGENVDELLKTPLQVGAARYPHLILLLDGFNEVTATSNELILEINELRAPDKYPGIQLVLSSRVDMRQACQWQRFHLLELQPLSDQQIDTFLKQPLPTDARLLELLRNPMMLSIYAAQTELPQRYREKGLLKETVTSTGEMLFNVELLQRIKIEELYVADLREQAFQRFVLEHLLPAIGWQMQQAELFFLEKEGRQQSMEEILLTAIKECLSEECLKAFPFFRKNLKKKRFKKKPWKLLDSIVDEVCCHGLALLVTEDGNYRFLHQNFRDYFAARYVQNRMQIALKRRTLPEVLKKAPLDFYLRQLLGELEGEHANKMEFCEEKKKWEWSKGQFLVDNYLSRLLELCRGVYERKELGYTAWNILMIWKEQRGELSGLDLKRLNFKGFSFNGLRLSRIGLTTCFTEGVLIEENLFSQGHFDSIASVSYSPKGEHIISRSNDGYAKIWDAGTGYCLQTINGLTRGRSHKITYSPDGKFILSCDTMRSVKVWEAESGNCRLILKGHSGAIRSATYSPDGQRILTSSSDTTAKIWDATTGKCLLTLHGLPKVFYSITYSPDGKQIAFGSGQIVEIWNLSIRQRLLRLEGHSAVVSEVVFSPDGEKIVSVSDDHTAKLWDARNGKCILTFEGHSGWVNSVTFSPDGQRILTTSEDTTVRVWEINSGQCLIKLYGHTGWSTSAAFSPDGSRIVTGSSDRTIRVWDSKTGQCLINIAGQSARISKVSFSQDGKRFLSNSSDCTVKIWDIETFQCFSVLQGHTAWVWSSVYSRDRQYIVSVSWDKTIIKWKAETGYCLWRVQGHSGFIWSVDYSPDGKYILTSSDDKTAIIWEAETGKTVFILRGHSGSVINAKFSPDGKLILTASEDQTAKLWDVDTGKCLFTFHDQSEDLIVATFSPDGRFILLGVGSTVKLLDLETKECILILRNNSSRFDDATISPGGKNILTGSSDCTANIWNISSGKCQLSLEGHSDRVWSVSFSPNGQLILTGSMDNTIRIWDVKSGKCEEKLSNIPGLLIQGCDFRNLHPDSQLSDEAIALLRQYGGIFDDEDARRWTRLCRKHGMPLPRFD